MRICIVTGFECISCERGEICRLIFEMDGDEAYSKVRELVGDQGMAVLERLEEELFGSEDTK
jgi:hypothetical protein